MLASVAIALLVGIGWFVFDCLTQPTQLARFLPADSTFAYFQLATTRDATAFKNLQTLYAGIPPTELADGTALGLTDVDQFLVTVADRVGIAFFGTQFDSARYAIFADITDETAVQNYFKTQLLPDETLVETAYRGDTIFTFARSRSTAFALIGDDHLIYAANVATLQNVLDAARGRVQKLSEAPDYGAVIARLDPRAVGFAYLSPSAVRAFALQKLAGLDYALAGALVTHLASGGVALMPTEDGLSARVFFAAAPLAARAELFGARPKLHTALTQLIALESPTWWYAGHDAADVLAAFRMTLATTAERDAALVSGYVTRLTNDYFGRDATIADVASLFSNDFLVGQTSLDELFFIAKGEGVPSAAPRVIALLTSGAGLLTAGEETFTLPDGSTGRRRTSSNVATMPSSLGLAITTIGSNGHAVSYALVGDTFIAATTPAVVARLLDRLAAPTFSETIDYHTDDVFARTVPIAFRTLPWLAPFTHLVGGTIADPAGMTVELELRK